MYICFAEVKEDISRELRHEIKGNTNLLYTSFSKRSGCHNTNFYEVLDVRITGLNHFWSQIR